MNTFDYIIIAAIAVLFALALAVSLKDRKKGGCSGCEGCAGKCSECRSKKAHMKNKKGETEK